MNANRIEEFTVLRDQCALIVSSLGATVMSWEVDGEEMIFVSENSRLPEGPINGGMPLVFPHFGEWDEGKPLHGFAKSSIWDFDHDFHKNNPHSLRFHLKDNHESRNLWDHSFELIYDLQLLEANELQVSLQVLNTSDKSFDFHFLFHPYFKVNAEKVAVVGLHGLDYIDKTDNFSTKTEARKLVTVDKFTDYVYLGTPPLQALSDDRKTLKILKSDTLPNTVVWNPMNLWHKFGLAENEDKNYICVEGGNVVKKVKLPAEESWQCSMLLTPGKI